MPSSFPDFPGRKIPYDADGTIVTIRYPQDGAPYEDWYAYPAASMAEWNDDDESVTVEHPGSPSDPKNTLSAGVLNGNSLQNAWIFPELRDLYGLWVSVGYRTPLGNKVIRFEVSTDCNHGSDGTWTTIWVGLMRDIPMASWPEDHRTVFLTFEALGVRGFRTTAEPTDLVNESQVASFHLYGQIATGQTPDRLIFIDEDTGLEYTVPQDWGDTPRGTTMSHDISVKNNSSTLTATAITMSFEAVNGGSDLWHTVKETGGAYGSTAYIASIAPGATYPGGANVFTIKCAVPGDAGLGLYEGRIKLTAPTWT